MERGERYPRGYLSVLYLSELLIDDPVSTTTSPRYCFVFVNEHRLQNTGIASDVCKRGEPFFSMKEVPS
jgi:hypothetical protein